MIWRPRPGQAVVLRYARRHSAGFPHHNQHGVVVAAGHGPGPLNVLVKLRTGSLVVVPRGNLVADLTGG